MSEINLLYVDDEEGNLVSFKATFRRDFNIFLAESGAKGLEILKSNHIDVIVTDQRMPEMTGVEFLEKVIEYNPEPIRLLLTGYTDIQAVIDAINKGKVYHYLTKPWEEEYLRNIILKSYEVYSLRKKNKYMMEQLKITNEQLEFMLRQHLLS